MVARGVNPSMNVCPLKRRALFIAKAKLIKEEYVPAPSQKELESAETSLSRGTETLKVAVCTCLDHAIEVRFCSSDIISRAFMSHILSLI